MYNVASRNSGLRWLPLIGVRVARFSFRVAYSLWKVFDDSVSSRTEHGYTLNRCSTFFSFRTYAINSWRSVYIDVYFMHLIK